MTADGTSSSTVMSASASDRTVNTRAPAPVNASAMLSAIKGASSQMRIEQPAKLALYIGAIPARLSASARGAALLRVAANPEPSINPQMRNKRDDRLSEGPGRVAKTDRVLRECSKPMPFASRCRLKRFVQWRTLRGAADLPGWGAGRSVAVLPLLFSGVLGSNSSRARVLRAKPSGDRGPRVRELAQGVRAPGRCVRAWCASCDSRGHSGSGKSQESCVRQVLQINHGVRQSHPRGERASATPPAAARRVISDHRLSCRSPCACVLGRHAAWRPSGPSRTPRTRRRPDASFCGRGRYYQSNCCPRLSAGGRMDGSVPSIDAELGPITT
jgi:hypothetical protein